MVAIETNGKHIDLEHVWLFHLSKESNGEGAGGWTEVRGEGLAQ